MNKKSLKRFIVPALTLSAAMALTACAGAPAPQTEIAGSAADETEKVQTVAESASVTSEMDAPAAVKEDAPAKVSQSEAPAEKPAAKIAEAQPTVESSSSVSSSSATAPDPYTAFPALANQVLTYADSLFKNGLVDSATTYLQRFRIIKPLWIDWENQADSLLNEFGKTNAERAKQFEPMVLEIQNMNRANASYSLVAEAVDSLIQQMPGDSLTTWARTQKETARKNTLKKALKEKTEILQLAENKGQFVDAMKKAQEFQMRYRDFEEELMIAQMIAYIDKLSNDVDAEAQKYWSSHDPAAALKQTDTLIAAQKFSEANELLTKLKSSNLRKEAYAKYQNLAEVFCTTKRKEATQLFAKAGKQKKPEAKRQNLQEAIGALNQCIEGYPEYEKMKTVLDNKLFLEKELDR